MDFSSLQYQLARGKAQSICRCSADLSPNANAGTSCPGTRDTNGQRLKSQAAFVGARWCCKRTRSPTGTGIRWRAHVLRSLQAISVSDLDRRNPTRSDHYSILAARPTLGNVDCSVRHRVDDLPIIELAHTCAASNQNHDDHRSRSGRDNGGRCPVLYDSKLGFPLETLLALARTPATRTSCTASTDTTWTATPSYSVSGASPSVVVVVLPPRQRQRAVVG